MAEPKTVNIKQSELAVMDRAEIDDFEITGRNLDTGVASRMSATEFLYDLNEGVSTACSNLMNAIHNKSTTGQRLDSNLTLGINPDEDQTRSKLLLLRSDGAEESAVFLGVYGPYEQEEHASTHDPTCVNHCGEAIDGTVVGPNVIVNYRETKTGSQETDAFAYLIKDIQPILTRLAALETGSNRYKGDLSATGSSIRVTLGSVTILVRRLDANTLEVRATASVNTPLPLTHRYAGGSLTDAVRITNLVATPAGAVIDTVGVGNIVIADFYTEIDGFGYDITAGSNDNELTQAWVEVKRSNIIQSTQASAAMEETDPFAPIKELGNLLAKYREDGHNSKVQSVQRKVNNRRTKS